MVSRPATLTDAGGDAPPPSSRGLAPDYHSLIFKKITDKTVLIKRESQASEF